MTAYLKSTFVRLVRALVSVCADPMIQNKEAIIAMSIAGMCGYEDFLVEMERRQQNVINKDSS